MFLLFAVAIAALFVVAGIYTLGKKLVRYFKRRAERTLWP